MVHSIDSSKMIGNSLEVSNFNRLLLLFYFILFEIEGRHVKTKAHVVIDHQASFPLGREEISQPI